MHASYHHGDLREALVRAALEGLDRGGTMPSWRALARACGVSQTAPYRHFASLEALQAAVAAACFRRFVAWGEKRLARERDPFARVAAAIRGYVRFATEHPHWYALMFGNAVDYRRYEEAQQAGLAAFALLADAVRDCGVPQPEQAAYVLWAGHHGLSDLVRLGMRPPGTPATGEATELLVAMSIEWLRGLAGSARKAPARRRVRRASGARPSGA